MSRPRSNVLRFHYTRLCVCVIAMQFQVGKTVEYLLRISWNIGHLLQHSVQFRFRLRVP